MKENKIRDKTEEIEKYLEELSRIAPSDLKTYKENLEKKAACERYFEKIIEAVVDLAFMIIRKESLKIPEEDKCSFDVLAEEKIIPRELATKLKDAKGMRNILSHQYCQVDDETVFVSITEELNRDVKEFLELIKSY